MGEFVRPVMIVAMPSSGSDWLVRCIKEAAPELQHPPMKEFFTPICNMDRYRELAKVFGCETIDTFRNIAKPVDAMAENRFHRLCQRAWNPQWHFTKEVWVGFQLELISQHFDCIGLVRREENTFPPQRLRVWQWYGAIADSLIANNRWSHHSQAIQSKAKLAHRELRATMLHGLKHVIHYEDLVSADEARVAAACRPLSRLVDPVNLSRVVRLSATSFPRPPIPAIGPGSAPQSD